MKGDQLTLHLSKSKGLLGTNMLSDNLLTSFTAIILIIMAFRNTPVNKKWSRMSAGLQRI